MKSPFNPRDMVKPSEEMVAAIQIAAALIRFDPEQQERILHWTRSNLRVLASPALELPSSTPSAPYTPVRPTLPGATPDSLAHAASLAVVAKTTERPPAMERASAHAPVRPIPLPVRPPSEQPRVAKKSDTSRIHLLATQPWVEPRGARAQAPTPPPEPVPSRRERVETARARPAKKSDTSRIHLLAAQPWVPSRAATEMISPRPTVEANQNPSTPRPHREEGERTDFTRIPEKADAIVVPFFESKAAGQSRPALRPVQGPLVPRSDNAGLAARMPRKCDTAPVPFLATKGWIPSQAPISPPRMPTGSRPRVPRAPLACIALAPTAPRIISRSILEPLIWGPDIARITSRPAERRIVSRPTIVRLLGVSAIVRIKKRPVVAPIAPEPARKRMPAPKAPGWISVQLAPAWVAIEAAGEWAASQFGSIWAGSHRAGAWTASQLAFVGGGSRQSSGAGGSYQTAGWMQPDSKSEGILNVNLLKHVLALGAALALIYLTELALEYFK